jgi:hypothetical protein
MKYIETEKLEVGDISLLELYNVVYKQNKIIAELLEQLKDKHIVSRDSEYIVKLEDKLYRTDQLELVAAQDLKYPLNYYTIENGQIKLDRKKVVTL